MKNEVSFDERVPYLRMEINCNFEALKRWEKNIKKIPHHLQYEGMKNFDTMTQIQLALFFSSRVQRNLENCHSIKSHFNPFVLSENCMRKWKTRFNELFQNQKSFWHFKVKFFISSVENKHKKHTNNKNVHEKVLQ